MLTFLACELSPWMQVEQHFIVSFCVCNSGGLLSCCCGVCVWVLGVCGVLSVGVVLCVCGVERSFAHRLKLFGGMFSPPIMTGFLSMSFHNKLAYSCKKKKKQTLLAPYVHTGCIAKQANFVDKNKCKHKSVLSKKDNVFLGKPHYWGTPCQLRSGAANSPLSESHVEGSQTHPTACESSEKRKIFVVKKIFT